jgi:hypothetical protein
MILAAGSRLRSQRRQARRHHRSCRGLGGGVLILMAWRSYARTHPPTDLACRELVTLVTDYLDGVLPPNWKAGIDRHLNGCDGCTRYLQQLRATIDALERLHVDNHRPET